MMINTTTTLLRDITLLYEHIDRSTIDMRKLKTLFDMQPMAMDTPDFSVIVYPPLQLIIQIADRHIRVTHQQKSDTIDAIPLWDIANTCRKLVTSRNIIAYGFNYDILSTIDSALLSSVTNRWFFANREAVGTLLAGEIIGFSPRVQFKRKGITYDLILEELSPGLLKSHLNAHFETNRLPQKAQLKASFIAEYESFRSLLHRLFNEE